MVMYFLESLKRWYWTINGINYVRSGIRFKIKWKGRKFQEWRWMSWSLLMLMSVWFVLESLKFSIIKSIAFLKSVWRVKNFPLWRKVRGGSKLSWKPFPAHTILLKITFYFLRINICAYIESYQILKSKNKIKHHISTTQMLPFNSLLHNITGLFQCF